VHWWNDNVIEKCERHCKTKRISDHSNFGPAMIKQTMNSLAVAQFYFALDGFLFEWAEDDIPEGHLHMGGTITRDDVGIAYFGDVVEANAQADVDHHFVSQFFVQFVGDRLVSRLVEQVRR
jgi:hypothetical protein